jgi:superfamily I DNA/RNA helicase/mRNA-degrading endonuclease RelE of RelBE toxin-antitoxin system
MLDTGWLTTMKETFQAEWLALPPKESHQVLEKINLLTKDPRPDGNLKKQLTHINRQLHRLESGNYRIFYTFAHPYISLLALRRRRENTYDEVFESEYLGGLDSPLNALFAPRQEAQNVQAQQIQHAEAQPRAFSEPINKDLLVNLLIPAHYHAALLHTKNEDELLNCQDVPEEFRLKVALYLAEKPLDEVFQERDYVLPAINDLMKFKKGELLGFLLLLSPEQERYASWGLNSGGPTLLKGGPGTGKSTIALYRVRTLVETLRQQGLQEPRILFTTYTNALIRSSEQLLQQLLGDDSRYVEVQTADRLVRSIITQLGQQKSLINETELGELLLQAYKEAQFPGDTAQQRTQRQAIERLGFDYVQQEIQQVIVAQQIETYAAYANAARVGRRVALNKMQRQALWALYIRLQQLLMEAQKEMFEQQRARAERAITSGEVTVRYDAVIVDEAQDLDPSVLRLLVQLCQETKYLFITADANQSIYGSHFRWTQIHEELHFRGHTAVLHTNYRSTQEIGEAAQHYLAGGALDSTPTERQYTYHGPLPIMRKIFNEQDEAQLLASYLSAAARTYQLPLDACAILCPNERAGRALAVALGRYDIDAMYMPGQQLDLGQPSVKIITLNSAKGLEFPIVALAGLHKAGKYLHRTQYATPEEEQEMLALERRLLFVGMTRAMRALLVAVPAESSSPLMQGFDSGRWNIGQR